jgi:hypothetical protein
LKALKDSINTKISEENNSLSNPDINDDAVHANIDLLKEKSSSVEQCIKSLQTKLLKPSEI